MPITVLFPGLLQDIIQDEGPGILTQLGGLNDGIPPIRQLDQITVPVLAINESTCSTIQPCAILFPELKDDRDFFDTGLFPKFPGKGCIQFLDIEGDGTLRLRIFFPQTVEHVLFPPLPW